MSLRRANLARISGGLFDVLVVGGGINGAVSAASLAGRGATVALVDRGDFGAFTSQESSNLVWGGFKYLENYELPLVFGLCRSRNRLMKAYPDNVREIGFLAALDRTAPYRPWFAALGATAYWGIGAFGTGRPHLLSAEDLETEEPAVDTTTVRGAIQYQDAYLVDNDSRFVFSFVRSAIEAGASVANYVELVHAERDGDRWVCTLRDTDSGEEMTTAARVLVNAAGPFVDVVNDDLSTTTGHRIVYSKGIHLVVPRLTTTRHDRVLAFFDDTQRLFYVIPMGHRSVIGTTDTRVDEPFTSVTDEDRDFLLAQINARLDLEQPLTRADVIAERCGVRPLVVSRGDGDHTEADWTSLSRKHVVERDDATAVVTVLGGKLTDCLNVGEEVAADVEALGVPLEDDLRNWYGEPAEGHPLGVLPAGAADAARQPAHPPRCRAAHRPPVAPLRPPGLRHARGDPRRPPDGRGRHGVDRLPAHRAAQRGRARDGRDPRRLHAPPQQDRPRRARRGHRRVGRPARGRRDPLRPRRGAPARRLPRRPRPGREATPDELRPTGSPRPA